MNWKELARSVKHWAAGVQTSYSQTGEDLIADFYLSGIIKGFYVDVGANDPVYLNNTYKFYRKGWRGLCIEPDIRKTRLIRLRRPKDQVLNLGIGQNAGQLPYYVLDPDTLSTFSAAEAGEFRKLGHRLVKTETVAVLPLSQVLRDRIGMRAIDLMSVDTEGWDLEVLKSNDWKKFRPKIIIVETAEYRKETMVRDSLPINSYLSSKNYVKLADTYINGIYASAEFAQAHALSNIMEH